MSQDQETPNVDPHFDNLMVKIQEYLKPAADYEDATLRLTTPEVFERLQAFYPSATYDASMVASALLELGYPYQDPFKELNFMWLFK